MFKGIVFIVVMYGCENWTIRKAEYQNIECFWTVVLEKTLRVSWTARRSSQSIIKEINLEYPWEGLMLRLKLQCFHHLMWRERTHWKGLWCWEWLRTGGKGWRGTENEMVGWHHWLNGHEFDQTSRNSEGNGSLACCSPWISRLRQDWVSEQQIFSLDVFFLKTCYLI